MAIITFEGIDNCGKTSQIQALLDYLKEVRAVVEMAREPGGTALGEALRTIIKHPQEAIPALWEKFRGHEDFPNMGEPPTDFDRDGVCEMLMFLAARAAFVPGRLKPALTEPGKIILVDRFIDSTRAYQGGGRFYSDPEAITLIDRLNRFILGDFWPDTTFLLDITVEEMRRRQAKRPQGDSHFEKECDDAFFERTRQEFLNIARGDPRRVMIIDGTLPREEITRLIIGRVDELLKIAR